MGSLLEPAIHQVRRQIADVAILNALVIVPEWELSARPSG